MRLRRLRSETRTPAGHSPENQKSSSTPLSAVVAAAVGETDGGATARSTVGMASRRVRLMVKSSARTSRGMLTTGCVGCHGVRGKFLIANSSSCLRSSTAIRRTSTCFVSIRTSQVRSVRAFSTAVFSAEGDSAERLRGGIEETHRAASFCCCPVIDVCA